MSTMSTPKWSQQIRKLFSPQIKTTAAIPAANISILSISEQEDISIASSGSSIKPNIQGASVTNTQPDKEHQSKVINYILVNLLKETSFPGPIFKAFMALGYTQAMDFAIINLLEMQELNPQLSPAHWRNLQNLQEYYFFVVDNYEVDTLDEGLWLQIEYQHIMEHQIKCSKERNKNNSTSSNNTSPQITPVTPSTTTNLQDPPKPKTIRESVKKDPNAYPEFKEDRQYEHWITSVKAFANLHGTLNVLNASYVPADLWEQQAFEEQQAFMWSVVVIKVTSANGKMYIRQYPGDAQKIFHMLHEEHRESLKAEYNAEEIKKKIENMKLDTWNGTYVSFVQQWENLIHIYDDLTINKGTNTGIVALTDG